MFVFLLTYIITSLLITELSEKPSEPIQVTASDDNAYCAFNNMRTLKFKAQPTNMCFATVNQLFGGSSPQLPTTAERAEIKSLSTVQATKLSSAVVGSWEEPLNV